MKAKEVIRAVYKQQKLLGYRARINSLIRNAKTPELQKDLASYGSTLTKVCVDDAMWNICNTKYKKEYATYSKYFDAFVTEMPMDSNYIDCIKILKILNQA
jgi:hypothetical protein